MLRVILSILFVISLSLCSVYEDVIYLKDGSVIYGTIIEQKPGDYYKVKSGKSSMIIKADEVEMIKREEIVTHGCLDSKACNYNPNASIENNSCVYAEENYDCDGNCTTEVDCAGECGGGLVLDCTGLCGGDATLDVCGTCGGLISDSFFCSDKKWSFSLPFSGRAMGLSLIRDFKLADDHSSLYIYLSRASNSEVYGHKHGASDFESTYDYQAKTFHGINYGFGYSYHENYNATGLIASSSLGLVQLRHLSQSWDFSGSSCEDSYMNCEIYLDGEQIDQNSWHPLFTISFVYQIKAKKSNFWIFGVMFFNAPIVDDISFYNTNYRYTTSFAPVISWGVRF